METVPRWAWWALLAFSAYALAWFGRRDWRRWAHGSIRVSAVVVGHRLEKGDEGFMAIYAFDDQAGQHQVHDEFSRAKAAPSVGTVVDLIHPRGRPDLARRPRPVIYAAIYAGTLAIAGLAIASLLA